MRVGIVGPISKDTVKWPNGETVSKFGSVVYTAAVLAKLFEGLSDEVVCLSHIALNNIEEVNELLDHPNIKLACSGNTDDEGAEIILQYINQHERISSQSRIMTPISFEEMSTLIDCDYIILMPLNETDIGLEQMQQFRNQTAATIFLDIHGLITGVDHQGKRYKKNWEQSKCWLKTIDILKMNEEEASWASGRLLGTFSDYLEFGVDMVKKEVSTCWITFGNKSSLVVWRRSDKILWATVPVTNTGEVVDTIGCGDAASAGFIYAYAKSKSPLIGVVMGNMLGSVKASTCEISIFPTRPEAQSLLYQHYREYFHKLLDQFLSHQNLIVNEIKEDREYEGFMLGSNGDEQCHGTDHSRSSHS